MPSKSIKPLYGPNYDEWAIEVGACLREHGLWNIACGKASPPRKPYLSSSESKSVADDIKGDPEKPDLDTPEYMIRFDKYVQLYEQYCKDLQKTSGIIYGSLDASLKIRYNDEKWISDPAGLWTELQNERERVLKIDDEQLFQRLFRIKLSEFDTAMKYYTEIKKIVSQLEIIGVKMDQRIVAFCMMNGFPDAVEWTNLKSTLRGTGNSTDPEKIMQQLEPFEAELRRKNGVPADTALFAKSGTRYKTHGKGNGNGRNGSTNGKGNNGNKANITCYGCGEKGHKKTECKDRDRWDPKFDKRNNTGSANKVQCGGEAVDTLMLSLGAADRGPIVDKIKTETPDKGLGSNHWIVDSGATNHVTGCASLFVNYRQLQQGVRVIKVADDRYINVTGIGDIVIAFDNGDDNKYVFRDVLHVSELGKNSLLSVHRLLSDEFNVDFAIDSTRLTRRNKIVATGPVIGGLFYVAALDEAVNSTFAYKTDDTRNALLWHNRLGHLSLRAVKNLSGHVNGLKLDKTGTPDTCLCEACILGKLYRKPFLPVDPTRRSTRPMNLVHSDVIGPFQTPSHSGKRYIVVFTDDCTRWSEAYFITLKSEVPAMFKAFQAKISNMGYGPIRKLRTDGGGEYQSADFHEYLKKAGIVHQTTAPYSPASNGIAERTNRGILDPTRSMLKHAGLSNSYWAEAASVAIYIKNRVVHRALGKSPYEALYGQKPDIGHLRVFGCAAYAHIPVETGRKKLDDRARRCIFLGYTDTESIWRLYDLATKRVFTSRDVRFDENTVYKHLQGQKTEELVDLPEPPSDSTPNIWDDDLDKGPVTSPDQKPHREPTRGDQVKRRTRGNDLDIDMNWQPAGGAGTRSGRQRGNNIAETVDMVNYIGAAKFIDTVHYAAQGPKTYREALQGEDADQWRAAIASEMDSLKSHEVFDKVESPPDSHGIVDSKWVLSIKLKVDGSVDKYKARLVARGYSQNPEDYGEITSPVIDAAAIRYTLGYAAIHDLEIATLDVPTAYLGATLHEEVYMRLPDADWSQLGYPDESRPIVKLRKSVPGLKQSGRCWYDDISTFLTDTFGLRQAVSAPGLFYSTKGDILINLYVDDLLIVAKEDSLHKVVNVMGERFSTKGDICGDTFAYIGLAIKRDRDQRQIYVNQSGYLRKVLSQFDMLGSRGRTTPMDQGTKLRARTEDSESFDQGQYRQAIGSLLYAALGSRPDITFAVGILGRFASNPSIEHWSAVKHLMRYIKSTIDISLPLVNTNMSGLLAYADADHAGDTIASKSTSGYLIYVDGILVLWKSKKQGIVAQSTMEAELVAMAEAWKNLQWVQDILQEIGHRKQNTTPTILNDNQSGVLVLNSGNLSSDSRHMRLRFHHLVDCIKKELLTVEYVPTNEMLADGLTKALGGVKHREFVKMLRMA